MSKLEPSAAHIRALRLAPRPATAAVSDSIFSPGDDFGRSCSHCPIDAPPTLSPYPPTLSPTPNQRSYLQSLQYIIALAIVINQANTPQCDVTPFPLFPSTVFPRISQPILFYPCNYSSTIDVTYSSTIDVTYSSTIDVTYSSTIDVTTPLLLTSLFPRHYFLYSSPGSQMIGLEQILLETKVTHQSRTPAYIPRKSTALVCVKGSRVCIVDTCLYS